VISGFVQVASAAPNGLYPNIVFILVDDQGAMLGEADDHMPKLKANVIDGAPRVQASVNFSP
jgi:hypothetical protein